MNVLTIQGLCKSFGSHQVLGGLDLQVPQGSVYGFIGKNGAGKTTTMKLVLGLLRPDAGTITVCGEPVRFGRAAANGMIGYLPDVPAFYPYMTARQYLDLCGEIIGLRASTLHTRADALLDVVGLDGVTKRIGGYSRGMKQRLGIAQALLTEPKLLICDEPTSALDPVGRREILDILRRIADQTTVIFSTHVLSDVERICDRVGVLDEGRLVISGTLAELRARHSQEQLRLVFATEEALRHFLSTPALQPFLSQTEIEDTTLIITSRRLAVLQRTVFGILAETGSCPVSVEVMAPSLEHLFMEVTQ